MTVALVASWERSRLLAENWALFSSDGTMLGMTYPYANQSIVCDVTTATQTRPVVAMSLADRMDLVEKMLDSEGFVLVHVGGRPD